MRFLHTSDWHIGRLFQNISLLDDQLFVLEQILNYAKLHEIDALVISGDIYDRAIPPANAVAALDKFLIKFEQTLNIPIIMISGNHDSPQRLSFGAKQMQRAGLHILTQLNEVTCPVVISKKDSKKDAISELVFYGVPYHDPVQVREAFTEDAGAADVKNYDQAHTYLAEKALNHKKQHYPNTPAVLLSHCFITGASESDSERPLSIGGADQVSWQPLTEFDYVALGHLHAPQYKGAEHIRYSGSLLKYSFSEYNQKKAVTLVNIDSDNTVTTSQLELKPKHDLRIIEGTIDALLENAKSDKRKHDYILARLTDKQVILDPIGRLRKFYPNILQIERTNFALSSGSKLQVSQQGTQNQRDEQHVFSDFFKQVMSNELTEEQQLVLIDTIAQAKHMIEGE